MSDGAAEAGEKALRRNEFGQPIGEPITWSGARRPAPVVLRGREVRLEPLSQAHTPDLYAALGDPRDDERWTYLAFEPCHSEAAMAAVVADLMANPGFVPFAICRPDGRAVGFAAYLRIDPAMGTIEVGSILYASELARTRAATEAMALLAGHAFDELGYRRYEWKCDALNAPSRRAAVRLGFQPEGVWRQALVYKGRNRDTAWLAMTDTDWPRIRTAYETWLDPANTDERGHQRVRLSELTARRSTH